LTDAEINELIHCPKMIDRPPRREMTLEGQKLHNDFYVRAISGSARFHVFMRRHRDFPENFSVGLEYLPEDGTDRFIIFRCNGPHHAIPSEPIPGHHDFYNHIHQATEENLERGLRAERDACITEDYLSYDSALYYFLRECSISGAEAYFPKATEMSLFIN
jgi:hypothetical protein